MKSALSTGMRSMPYVANRRMGLRWLKYGEGLRGLRRFPLFADVSLDDIAEFAPYMFTLALSTKPDGLTLQFVGKELESDCGGDVTNKELSNLPPQSLLARAIQQHSKVIADRGPVTVSDNFSNMQGHEIRYRAVMLPFSSAGNEIDYIIGVITWTAVMSGAAPDESDEGANAGSMATTEDAQQSVPIDCHNPKSRDRNRHAPRPQGGIRPYCRSSEASARGGGGIGGACLACDRAEPGFREP